MVIPFAALCCRPKKLGVMVLLCQGAGFGRACGEDDCTAVVQGDDTASLSAQRDTHNTVALKSDGASVLKWSHSKSILRLRL